MGMQIDNNSNKRIAKNTMLLYLRMIFILVVGLFTGRVVLNTLGVADYGIYNVVGGFVTMFTFLNGAMSTATQRFITFELARGEIERQKTVFSTSIIIHFALAAIILLLAETIGLWFVFNKLVIPEERFTATLWVYQLSILSCCLSIISLPYNAEIIAHEKMSAFAFISIIDVSLKLVIVYLIQIFPWDKLIFFAILMFLVQLLDRIIYGVYCSRHFPEARFKVVFDKRLLKDMNHIASWSLFGNLAGVGYTQGLNVLLNMFFGPAVNAARGVAVTIQGVVSGFVSNFQMALNPQITKSYAVNDLNRMHSLIYASSKFSFFLLLIIVLPLFLEAEMVLTLWLKLVPGHAVWFMRLMLCIMLVEALANPLMVSSQATGNVKVYQSVVGGTLLLIIPIAYVVLRMGGNPESVFVTHLIFAILAQYLRIWIIAGLIQMSIIEYCKKVVIQVAVVFILSIVPSYIIYHLLPDTLSGAIIVIVMSLLLTISSIFFVGLTEHERLLVYSKIIFLINSKNKHA